MAGFYRCPRLAAALLSSCALIAAPAHAQAVSDPAEEQEGEAIVVTGVRGSLESAIRTKRNAGAIVDAISSEDVGKFPDENAAESLQRITGVQVSRNRGEAQQVTIRGLPSAFTLVEYNGRTLPSTIGDNANVSRSFNFSILPSEFIGSLEVYKTPTADMAEGGLSGTVIMRTPRALKLGRSGLSVSAQGAWEDNTRKVEPRLSALYTGIFADGKLGLTLGGAYTRRTRETHWVDNAGFREDAESLAGGIDLNGDGKIVRTDRTEYVNSVRIEIDKERTERISTLGSIEFAPGNGLRLTVEGLYSRYDDEYDGQNTLILWQNQTGPTVPSAITIEPGRTSPRAVTYMADNVDVRGNGPYVSAAGNLLTVSAETRYEAGPWTLSAQASYSRSKNTTTSMNLATQGRFLVGYDATVDPDLLSVFYGGNDFAESMKPENYQLLTLNGVYDKQAKDEIKDYQFDISHAFEGSVLSKLSAGLRYTERSFDADNGRLVLDTNELVQLLGSNPGPSPAFGGGSVSAAGFMQLAHTGRGPFLGSYNGSSELPANWISSDTRSFMERFAREQLLAAGDGKNFTNDPTGSIDIGEKTLAGYVSAGFGNPSDRFSGNFGVRAVRTTQDASGIAPDLNAITYEPDAGGRTTIPGAGNIAIHREYWDFLPTLNARLELAPSLIGRFSASRTMARPTLSNISPTVTANGTRRVINQGNPYLDPFRSNNFDVSLEWYLGTRGLVSVAAFYKDIVSLVRNDTTTEQITVIQINRDGSRQPLALDFQVNAPNNGDGVTVKGIELSYQQPFTFLPAPFDRLGFIGNYTYLENSDPTQLTGTSKHNFNLSGYYEDSRFSVRLAYTFRDKFLSNATGVFGDGLQTEAFGILNGNLSVRLLDSVSAVFEATNLLDTPAVTTSLLGAPIAYEDSGRRFLFGLRGRF